MRKRLLSLFLLSMMLITCVLSAPALAQSSDDSSIIDEDFIKFDPPSLGRINAAGSFTFSCSDYVRSDDFMVLSTQSWIAVTPKNTGGSSFFLDVYESGPSNEPLASLAISPNGKKQVLYLNNLSTTKKYCFYIDVWDGKTVSGSGEIYNYKKP